MRAQYLRDGTNQGVEIARKVSFLVRKRHDLVFSDTYHSARDALTLINEIEAAKQLAKAPFDRARGKNPTSGGPAGSLQRSNVFGELGRSASRVTSTVAWAGAQGGRMAFGIRTVRVSVSGHTIRRTRSAICPAYGGLVLVEITPGGMTRNLEDRN